MTRKVDKVKITKSFSRPPFSTLGTFPSSCNKFGNPKVFAITGCNNSETGQPNEPTIKILLFNQIDNKHINFKVQSPSIAKRACFTSASRSANSSFSLFTIRSGSKPQSAASSPVSIGGDSKLLNGHDIMRFLPPWLLSTELKSSFSSLYSKLIPVVCWRILR